MQWASRVAEAESWIRPCDGQSCAYPAVFSGTGGADLADRMKQALMAGGFSPDVLGVPKDDGLIVGQEDRTKEHQDMDPSDFV